MNNRLKIASQLAASLMSIHYDDCDVYIPKYEDEDFEPSKDGFWYKYNNKNLNLSYWTTKDSNSSKDIKLHKVVTSWEHRLMRECLNNADIMLSIHRKRSLFYKIINFLRLAWMIK